MDTGNVIGRPLAAAALVLAAVWATPSSAGDRNGEFAVFSVGAHTCTDYLHARRQGDTAFEPYEQWLLGYLSAFNLIVADTYDIMGTRGYWRAVRWLDGYCAGHDGAAFIDASAALTVSFYSQRHVDAADAFPGHRDGNNLLRSAENTLER